MIIICLYVECCKLSADLSFLLTHCRVIGGIDKEKGKCSRRKDSRVIHGICESTKKEVAVADEMSIK